MTTSLVAALTVLIVAGGVGAYILGTHPAIGALVKRNGTMPPPMIGAISILFGPFVDFSAAEITARGGSLRLSTQREVGAARSILDFTAGVGPRAFAVRQALVEHLQVVTTTERDWLRLGAQGNRPAPSRPTRST